MWSSVVCRANVLSLLLVLTAPGLQWQYPRWVFGFFIIWLTIVGVFAIESNNKQHQTSTYAMWTLQGGQTMGLHPGCYKLAAPVGQYFAKLNTQHCCAVSNAPLQRVTTVYPRARCRRHQLVVRSNTPQSLATSLTLEQPGVNQEQVCMAIEVDRLLTVGTNTCSTP